MKDWIIPAIFLVIAYLLEFTRPWVRTFFKRGTLSIRNAYIKALKEQYKTYKLYRENHATLTVELINQFIYVFIYSLLLAFLAIFYITSRIKNEGNIAFFANPMGMLLGLTLSRLSRVGNLIETIANFEKYKEKTGKTLRKWGATLEAEEKKPVKRSKRLGG